MGRLARFILFFTRSANRGGGGGDDSNVVGKGVVGSMKLK